MLLLHIIFGSIYEVYGNPLQTNWSIAYNVANYITFSSMYMYIARKVENMEWDNKILLKHNSFLVFLLNVFGIAYLSFAAVDLTYINASFYDYFDAMQNEYFSTTQAIAIACAFIIYIFVYCVRNNKGIVYELK